MYFPLSVGDTWTYRRSSLGTDTTVVRTVGPKGVTVGGEEHEVVRVKGNVVERGFRKGGLKYAWEPALLLVAEPLTVGADWRYQGRCVAKGRVPERLNYDKTAVRVETVEVPAGKFEAIRVSVAFYDGDAHWKQVEWYAEGVGLVRRSGEERSTGLQPFVPFTEVLVSYKVGGG